MNEKRLIDANALKARIREVSMGKPTTWTSSAIMSTIDVQPTIATRSNGEFDILDVISSAYYGKMAYFPQEGGLIYSRISGKYLKTLDDAVAEFATYIGDNGEEE